MSLQELEREALATGDWSKVSQRETNMARRSMYGSAVNYCKKINRVLVCYQRGVTINPQRDCECLSTRQLKDAF